MPTEPTPIEVNELRRSLNERYQKNRFTVMKEDIDFGDWLKAKKAEVRSRGNLWRKAFEDPTKIDYSQSKAEKYMSMADNSVMRESSHAKIWPRSFYIRYLLSTMPESELSRRIEAGDINPKLRREEVEAWLRQIRRANSPPSRKPAFGRSINRSNHTGWRNCVRDLFGSPTVSNEPTSAQRAWEIIDEDVHDQADLVELLLMISTKLSQDRHRLGEGEPRKLHLLIQTAWEREREHDVLNDLARPMERHQKQEKIERLIEDAYADHRRERAETIVSEAPEVAEAADAAAA